MNINVSLDECMHKDLISSNVDLPKDLVHRLSDSTIPLLAAIELARWNCFKSKTTGFNQYMNNAKLSLLSPAKEPRSEELECRIKKLKQKEDQRIYNKMVSNVSKVQHGQKMKKQAPLTSGFNFAVTLVASVFATTYVLKHVVPNYGLRIGIGLVVGTIVMLIEVFLAVRAVQKEEAEQERTSR